MASHTLPIRSEVDQRTRQLQERSTKVVQEHRRTTVEDIRNERAQASFSVQDLNAVLYGGQAEARRHRWLAEQIAADPQMSKENQHSMSQVEAYRAHLAAGLHLYTDLIPNIPGGITANETHWVATQYNWRLPTALHTGMFIPTLFGQGSPEQQEEWLTRAFTFDCLGTYAQTELGHGTFLRGIETTATFDREKNEFVIHSTSPTAAKWWPGGLGKTANTCTLMCRLLIDGTDHGPHVFIVPLRDPDTHKPLPGVQLGDIGPTMGFRGVDNGYALFDHVRIPRDNMLMKYSKVSPDGTYFKPEEAKASYGTMLMVRSRMVSIAAYDLARACTIAVRYNSVRRQTEVADAQTGEFAGERQVIDYQGNMYTLFPLVATAVAYLFTGQYMNKRYDALQEGKESSSGADGGIAVLHATSAGLKALCTETAADGIEACRRTCGGHGYSLLSGLADVWEDQVGAITYEGENQVMYLQAARYLVRQLARIRSGETTSDICDYLAELTHDPPKAFRAATPDDVCNPNILREAFEYRALRLLTRAADGIAYNKSRGLSPGEAWNECMIDLVAATRAHCLVTVMRVFMERTSDSDPIISEAPKSTAAVLRRLLLVFALYHMETSAGDFAEDGYCTGEQLNWVRWALRRLLRQLRPDAVSLVDSFDFTDYFLNSTIGSFDGDVYKRMIDAAKAGPLNKEDVDDSFHTILAPRARL